jgi:hypothetical protein
MTFGYPNWTITIFMFLLIGTYWATPQEHKVPGLLFVIAMVLLLMLGLLTDRLPNPH